MVIINPAAGHDEPILNTLNNVFHPAGVDWDIRITHKSGDATRLAKEAVELGFEVVAGYGGDGTQMEVANGLVGTGVPQAILPGGTGNAMAHDLKIPIDLKLAAQLITTSHQRRAVDLARAGDKIYMLRAYAGVSQEQAASRESKDKLGQLAYIQAGLKYLTHINETPYRAHVDGELIEGKAVICYILNAGTIGGVLGIDLPRVGDVDISDGYLDLFVVTKGIRPLRAVSHYMFHVGDWQGGVSHYRGREITLETEPAQDVWIDGELDGKTPFTTSAVPQALEIVVPGDK
jgi:YegS/Rv2252/BmrU family lipid kinase